MCVCVCTYIYITKMEPTERIRNVFKFSAESLPPEKPDDKPIRICSSTFIASRDLKRCSRCQTTWYVNAAEQRKHWRLHKRCCKPLTHLESRKISECTSASSMYRSIIEGLPLGNHKTAAQLKRLREIFDNNEDDEGEEAHGELGYEMHTRMRGYTFYSGDWGMEKLWACPGVTQFLLCDWDAISAEQKHLTTYFPRGRPSSEYLQLYGSEFFSEKALLELEKYDNAEEAKPWGRTPGSYRFCWLAFNLLMGSAMRSQASNSSIHDGLGEIRKEKLLAFAASKRIIDLWCNKNVRRSCGDAMSPAVSFTFMFIGREGNPSTFNLFLEAEQKPGTAFKFNSLWPEKIVCAALGEFADGGAAKGYAKEILVMTCKMLDVESHNPAMLESMYDSSTRIFFPQMAYDLAKALKEDTQDGGMFDNTVLPLNECKTLLNIACGYKNISTKLFMWEYMANGNWEALGHDYEIRAFFYSLIRKCTDRHCKIILGKLGSVASNDTERTQSSIQKLPLDLLHHICLFACNPNAIDIYAHLKAWDKIPCPRSLQDRATTYDPEEMALARQKFSCRKVVMPPKLYEDWNESFGYETPEQKVERLAKARLRSIEYMRECDQYDFSKKQYMNLIKTMDEKECIEWILSQKEWFSLSQKKLVKMEEGTFTTDMIEHWTIEKLRSTIKKITGCVKWKQNDQPQKP